MIKESKKVLVTGGLGFIGSNLQLELERGGREVWLYFLVLDGVPNEFGCLSSLGLV